MCSIGGWLASAPLTAGDSFRLMRALQYYGATRGKQSTGVWMRNSVLNAEILQKYAVDPDTFIAKPEVWEAISGLEGANMALTHTRQPTCGGLGDEQAQPFQTGNVVTVHNGWYTNMKELKEAHGISKPSGVDSELVSTFIAAHGIESIETFLTDTRGSSAIACAVGEELYLARDRGPIEYVTLEIGEGIDITVFGSTEFQVLAAVRYLWLLPQFDRTTTLTSDSLFKVAPGTVEEVLNWRRQPPAPHQVYTPPNWHKSNMPNWAQEKSPTPARRVDDPPGARPPGVPDNLEEQARDYDALALKAQHTVLEDDEMLRLVWYIHQE